METLFDEAGYRALVAEAESELQSFGTDSGQVVMPLDAFIVTAQKVLSAAQLRFRPA